MVSYKILFAVRPQVELLDEALYVQILEACLQKPFFQEEMGDDSHALLIFDPEAIHRHLVDALAK